MKKLFALLLAVIMVVALFAGCTNGGNGGNEPANNGGSTEPVVDDFSWPLVDAEELSIWNVFSSTANTIVETKADTEYYKELQRRLNVNIKWLEVTNANSTEAFSLMLTDNDLPDLINVPAAGPGQQRRRSH